MKITINAQSAMITFTSENLADVRDLGRLSEILKVKATIFNNGATLECTAGQLLETIMQHK